MYKVPTMHHWVTHQGVPMAYVQASAIPMLEINVLFQAGSMMDGKQVGISQLTNAMIGLSTEHLTFNQLSKRFNDIGAQFHTSADRDISSLYLKTLTNPRYLAPCVRALEAILTQTTVTQRQFEITRKQFIQGIQQVRHQPETLVKHAFFQALYPHHPYGNPVIGTEESLSLLRPEDIEAFYHTYFVANNCAIVAVGDLSLDKARALGDQLTKNMRQGVQAPLIPVPKKAPLGMMKRIDSEAPQAHVLMGNRCVTPTDPHYIPILVGNEILGGEGFDTRLFTEVRTKRGLVYSIACWLMSLKARGPFTMTLQTNRDQVDEALALVEEILDDFVKNGPTPEELASTKHRLIRRFPLELAGNYAVLQEVTKQVTYNQPQDYFEQYLYGIEHVTADQIKQAYVAEGVSVDRMIKVIG